MDFKDLGLSEESVKIVTRFYKKPTDVQARTIPLLLEGKNVFVLSKTGSGKTAAFLLPLGEKNRKGNDDEGRREQKGESTFKALILTPTRELAKQIAREAKRIIPSKKVVTLYGGIPLERDTERLKSWDIIVATPGRMLDHYRRGNVGKVDTLIIDEADKMLDMGFIDDVKAIVKEAQPKQIGLFSATLHPELKRVFPTTFEEVALEEDNFNIKHKYVHIERRKKLSLLKKFLREGKKTIVFMNTQRGVEWLSGKLRQMGIRHVAIHGKMKQRKREWLMDKFRYNEVKVIISTDLLARGIDVQDVDLVINYDEAMDPKTHKHRIGRTARLEGKEGKAITFKEVEELPKPKKKWMVA